MDYDLARADKVAGKIKVARITAKETAAVNT